MTIATAHHSAEIARDGVPWSAEEAPRSTGPAHLGLYVHIPYCLTRCPYCDFNTYATRSWPEAEYSAALRAEIAGWAQGGLFRGQRIRTVFFGGGTPSLFASSTIDSILQAAASDLGLQPDAEITLEANPGTVDAPRLAELRAAGINRLSLGVQTFDDELLARLGRNHSAEDSRRALRAARKAGFTNLSLDLIYAIPGQDLVTCERDLGEAIAFAPDHISAYGLTYEKGTPMQRELASGRLRPVDEETELTMYAVLRTRLAAAGYERYEISSYARPGREALHNRAYWQGAPYLGIGAGAHSFAPPELTGGWGVRWSNLRDPRLYMEQVRGAGCAIDEREELTRSQAMGEACWLGLRQAGGLCTTAFAERFGLAVEDAYPQIATHLDAGWLERVDDRLVLSDAGLAVADSVFESFF